MKTALMYLHKENPEIFAKIKHVHFWFDNECAIQPPCLVSFNAFHVLYSHLTGLFHRPPYHSGEFASWLTERAPHLFDFDFDVDVNFLAPGEGKGVSTCLGAFADCADSPYIRSQVCATLTSESSRTSSACFCEISVRFSRAPCFPSSRS